MPADLYAAERALIALEATYVANVNLAMAAYWRGAEMQAATPTDLEDARDWPSGPAVQKMVDTNLALYRLYKLIAEPQRFILARFQVDVDNLDREHYVE